jgi:hypothetical protein
MHRKFLTLAFLAIYPALLAQQPLNNDAVIKLSQAGLPDKIIINTVSNSPGRYDTSPAAIDALRSAGVSDEVIKAIRAKLIAPIQGSTANPATKTPTSSSAINLGMDSEQGSVSTPIKLGLCKFQVSGSSKAQNAEYIVGVLGGLGPALAVEAGNNTARKYYRSLDEEVQDIYRATIEESGQYQALTGEHLVDLEGAKNLSLADTASRNKLFACISAKPSWAAQDGKDKKATILTNWEVSLPNGCRVRFITSVASDGTYKKLPNGADPSLNQVYLGLSKQDASKFLRDFPEAMKQAGCTK